MRLGTPEEQRKLLGQHGGRRNVADLFSAPQNPFEKLNAKSNKFGPDFIEARLQLIAKYAEKREKWYEGVLAATQPTTEKPMNGNRGGGWPSLRKLM